MSKLYYYPNNASLAPHFLLHEMALEYELLLVDRKANGQKSAEYLYPLSFKMQKSASREVNIF